MRSPCISSTILTFLFVALVVSTSGQQTTRVSSGLTKTDYLKKSQKQKTTGIVLLSSGTVMGTIGLAITLKNVSGIFDPTDPPSNNSTTADVLGYSGIVLAAVSIPFFMASSKNKKKAFSLSLKNDLIPRSNEKRIFNHSIPTMSIRMSL